MQIAVKVETGFNCNWRNIEPLQPDGFKGQTDNEKETLKNSIVKNGFHDAFDVWQHEGRLLSIDGVHRKIALLELAEEGYEIPEQLPCAYVTAENETEAATIILSRNSQHSHILSAAVMTAAFKIPAATIEAVVPQKNIEAWSESDNSITEQLTAEEDDFEFEDGGIETDIVIGDLFEIGEHRLLCGDSTDSDAVAKLMNGEKADMVFTDPPYNVAFNGRSSKFDVIKNDDLSDSEFKDFISGFVSVLNILSPKNYYIWCNWKFYGLLHSMVEYKACIVWAKNVFGLGRGYRHQHEFCLFNGKLDDGINNESDLWEIAKDTNYQHPTQKPIALADRALNNHKENNLIVDLFLGSGSTMVAAHQLNRKCYGMELEPKYCQVIINRMRKLDPTLIIKRNGVIYE